MKRLRWVMLVLVCVLALAEAKGVAAARPNILFIAIDDLRPELGCYGVKGIHSPNIDALAKQSLLFDRAYCQQAVCSPSRTSLLTGRRPDTTKIYNLQDHFRDTIPDVVTLPQFFKEHGYFAQSFGKVYHGGLDDPRSWSVPSVGNLSKEIKQSKSCVEVEETTPSLKPAPTSTSIPAPPKKKKKGNPEGSGVKGKPWSARDVPDNALVDGEMADAAIATMERVKDKPFFLAMGFRKPHLPFTAPKKYYDLYRLEDMKLASNPFPPREVFPPAMSDWVELRGYVGMPKEGPLTEAQTREILRGYYAATSYVDAQVGRVLAALDRLGLREKTIVILWGDHGWQLGEHGMWCKQTDFETSTRSVLMISIPGQKSAGRKTEALTEFVDVYPTLVELAGLPLPAGLEGTSFLPLIENPDRAWKQAAFSQYPRGKLMGYAMRTDRYRYVEWKEPGKEPEGRELYDHQNDPDENVNLGNRPESKELVAQLSRQLQAGWREAGPK